MTTTDPTPSEVASVVADRATSVVGVVRLDAGPFGTKSTYGSGRKIDGVTVKPGSVTVHIVVRFGERIPELAETVSREVAAALRADLDGSRPWDVGIEVVDVVTAGAGAADLPGGPGRELR